MNICGEPLKSDWYESQNTRQFYLELERNASTLLLHNMLAALERRIIDRLVRYYGEEGREIWERSTDIDYDEEIAEAVIGHWLHNYVWLHLIAARRDSAEIKELFKEAAA